MNFIKKSFMGMTALMLALSASASDNRPNIVLILADDVSPDMFSIYGQEGAAKTPNIDKLAEQGVRFQTTYATAKCGSSRVEIMTGRYAQTTGVYTNEIWLGNARKEVYSDNIPFSRVLKDAGYATGITGKWHAGIQMPYEDVLAFDEHALWEGTKEIAKLAGSPKFTGLMEDKKTTSRYWHPGYVVNGKLLDTKPMDYSLDIEADFIMAFMEKNAKAGKPFLAYWPTVAPHGTRTGMPTNPLRGKPGLLGQGKKIKKKDKIPGENHARFVSLIQYLDLKVGEVVHKINELGIADNTIIIFLSDNGTAVTAKTRGVERGSHVVHIAAGAGIKQRGLTTELSDFSDITPTLIDYANAWDFVPKGHSFNGKSLVPFYQGDTDTHREWIYGYAGTSQLLRTKNYMLEVVNPIMNMPRGRFYYTGEHRFGFGYKLVDGLPEHASERAKFDDILNQLPPLTRADTHWQTKSGKRVLKTLSKPKVIKKHLYNHADYKRYDETYRGDGSSKP
ncbi:sulfatase-like hydrolase/transferase [Psychrobium sp. nBUS_13]|uniref:sulfatase-like hydrolase/transferase n=1 Tax=Psychrobium sp. nBUS_13 TaxID=3395319 RepID=UPI003EBD49A6